MSYTPIISGFVDEYRFLSNFYSAPVTYQGITYPCTENAYQAAKFLHLTPKAFCQALPDTSGFNLPQPHCIEQYFASISPKKAKRLGRKLPLDPNWESKKEQIMRDLITCKFTQNLWLHNKLKDTKDAIIIETNYWHDNTWGNCTCERCANIHGENLLGKILMDVRVAL